MSVSWRWFGWWRSEEGDERNPLISAEEDAHRLRGRNEANATWLEKITFDWLKPLLALGNQRQLDFDDLYHLSAEDESSHVKQSFERAFNKERAKGRPKVYRALATAFGGPFFEAAGLKLVHDCLLFVGPLLLKKIISFLKDPEAPMKIGLYCVLGLFLSNIIQSICLRNYFYICYRTGMRLRSSVIVSVYEKSLQLSTAARQQRTAGEITNLMSVDATRLQDLTPYLHAVWYSVFQIIVACVLLWQQVGASCLGGIAVILILIPISTKVARVMRDKQKDLMKVKDERLKLNNEVLAGMKVIKFQAWEENFIEKMMEIRKRELQQFSSYLIVQSTSGTLWNGTAILVAIATFVAYTYSGHTLDVGTALTSLALFNVLRFPLMMLPTVVNNIVEAKVSLDRVEDFLLAEERVPVTEGDLRTIAVKVEKGSFEWDDSVDDEVKTKLGVEWQSEPKSTALQDINLYAAGKDLVAVVGHVGSGKTSLLCSLLGEIRRTAGSVAVRGRVAYVAQQPFIMNATLRDNILFGLPYEEMRYKKTLEVCALLEDLKVLPAGDMTEIGEKAVGINLSGGQKTRVSLARAVYADADIYLLDDPLSAVDSHVGKHIMNRCILGVLSQKLRILVTNGVSFLPRCDSILVMKAGRIVQRGTYQDLLRTQGTFLSLVDSAGLEGDSEDEEGDEEVTSMSEELNGSGLLADGITIVTKTRRNSRKLSTATDEAPKTPKKQGTGTLMTVEERAVGSVEWKVYAAYLRAAGGTKYCAVIFFVFSVAQAMTLITNWWLAYWSEQSDSRIHSNKFFLRVYLILSLATLLAFFIRYIILLFAGLRASQSFFQNILNRVLHAPMRFFDTTPLGRIINRMSKEVYTIDQGLPQTINSDLFQTVMLSLHLAYDSKESVLFKTLYSLAEIAGVSLVLEPLVRFDVVSVLIFGTTLMISLVSPLFLVVLVPIVMLYYYAQQYYIKTSRDLQRLDSISRIGRGYEKGVLYLKETVTCSSPIYALFGETLDGVSTIRAYTSQDRFKLKNCELVDRNQKAYYLTYSTNCWLAMRLEFAGACVVTASALLPVLKHGESNETFAGLAGLSISFALGIIQTLNWSVRMASDLETRMVAVERVKEYSEMETEGPYFTPTSEQHHIPSDWPQQGKIEFRRVSLRYRPDLPLVLKEISFTLMPRQKVGVVGRTGAGKSSLILGLLRLVEIESGTIIIDGVDCRKVGLYDLRSRLSIIPQDPVLFSGTIRSNLDPFSLYSDERVWQALERAHLKGRIRSLDDEVVEGGANFSVGQRQLVSIARALLRRSKVILMDEATASIDVETDSIIQRSIREEFQDCTCITIAHRLNTIMDSDKVLVLDQGKVVEFDTPNVLLELDGGVFKGLVADHKQTGE